MTEADSTVSIPLHMDGSHDSLLTSDSHSCQGPADMLCVVTQNRAYRTGARSTADTHHEIQHLRSKNASSLWMLR
jgi:hypothetical protein